MRRIPVLEHGDVRVVRVVSEGEGDLIPEHTHDGDEIAYVVSGRVRVHIEGKGDFDVSEGEAVLIPKGVKHRGLLSEGCVLIAFYHP
ncbi:MAG: cupin domain-containing protein [Candidatus Korarchaeum sp.]|nr:cupin domain-containing protein [Candidatus Korarchaeum sp.]MDW8036358.1 cupin domain-containing protein [Candidatus Korarchaeum sp.]